MTPEQQLEKWLDQEETAIESLEAGPGPGVTKPEQMTGKAGLEVLQAMMAGELPYAEMARSLAFYAVAMDRGFAAFIGTPKREFLNPMGTIHGGGWLRSWIQRLAVLSSRHCQPDRLTPPPAMPSST